MPGLFKIGRARRPARRLAAANTWCPHRAYVLVGAVSFTDAHQAEKAAHRMLRDCAHGGEWFHPPDGRHPINLLRGLRRRERNL